MKRLRKSEDAKVAGVCGGIAEYFDFDPTVVRVAVALGALVFGFVLILYIILAIAMPEN